MNVGGRVTKEGNVIRKMLRKSEAKEANYYQLYKVH